MAMDKAGSLYFLDRGSGIIAVNGIADGLASERREFEEAGAEFRAAVLEAKDEKSGQPSEHRL